MERWEYQVIHLNVEAPPPAPSPPPPAAPPEAQPAAEPAAGATPIRVEAVFSKEYLEKEFPGFYGGSPPAGAPAKEHPAHQLRGFLNLQGRDGWQLVGFYPVGQLQMMIFRRPLAAVEPSGEPAAAAAAPPAGETAPAVGQPGEAPRAEAALLETILARLEALERRLPSPPQAAAPQAPGGLADLQDGGILPAHQLDGLEDRPRLSTAEAARALGFRSATSLLNLAARSGYPRGLVKRGVHAALAVYVGSEKSGRGGRDRRLWVVLEPSDG